MFVKFDIFTFREIVLGCFSEEQFLLSRIKVFYKNKFLPNYKLSFTENLLVKNNKDKAATFISENGFREVRTWSQLNNNVSKVYKFLKKKQNKKK